VAGGGAQGGAAGCRLGSDFPWNWRWRNWWDLGIFKVSTIAIQWRLKSVLQRRCQGTGSAEQPVSLLAVSPAYSGLAILDRNGALNFAGGCC
jgi:hypothetical protein